MEKIINEYNYSGGYMDSEKMKNMIVLKNLPSNIVDEAIIILKNNKKVKAFKKAEIQNNGALESSESEQYIVREAEMVISNYLSKVEKEKQIKSYSMKQMENKYRKLKITSIVLGIIVLLNIIINI